MILEEQKDREDMKILVYEYNQNILCKNILLKEKRDQFRQELFKQNSNCTHTDPKYQQMGLQENKISCAAKETTSSSNSPHNGANPFQLLFRQGANIHKLQRHLEIKYQGNKTDNQ